MNPWQMAQQLKHLLQRVVWDAGAGQVVFGEGSVVVFAGAPDAKAVPPGFPFALVMVGPASMDEDSPELIEQEFSVTSVAEVAGDPLGEFALIGGARADLGKSAGAGVAEVAARVRSAVQHLTGFDGAKVLLSASRTSAPSVLGDGRHVAFDELTLKALCTSSPHYAAPQQLRSTGSALAWAGAHCSARFDFLRFRVGYKAGSTPPATPEDCDGIIYTGTATTFASGALLAGTCYAVFADYDPRGTGSVAASSAGNTVGAYIS